MVLPHRSPDDPHDARSRQREREVVDQQAIAETLGQALGLDDHVAESLPGRDDDLELTVGLAGGFGLGLQLFVCSEACLALRLAGLG